MNRNNKQKARAKRKAKRIQRLERKLRRIDHALSNLDVDAQPQTFDAPPKRPGRDLLAAELGHEWRYGFDSGEATIPKGKQCVVCVSPGKTHFLAEIIGSAQMLEDFDFVGVIVAETHPPPMDAQLLLCNRWRQGDDHYFEVLVTPTKSAPVPIHAHQSVSIVLKAKKDNLCATFVAVALTTKRGLTAASGGL